MGADYSCASHTTPRVFNKELLEARFRTSSPLGNDVSALISENPRLPLPLRRSAAI
jgi:hypothetical protein